jgi:hypothetical protein
MPLAISTPLVDLEQARPMWAERTRFAEEKPSGRNDFAKAQVNSLAGALPREVDSDSFTRHDILLDDLGKRY